MADHLAPIDNPELESGSSGSDSESESSESEFDHGTVTTASGNDDDGSTPSAGTASSLPGIEPTAAPSHGHGGGCNHHDHHINLADGSPVNSDSESEPDSEHHDASSTHAPSESAPSPLQDDNGNAAAAAEGSHSGGPPFGSTLSISEFGRKIRMFARDAAQSYPEPMPPALTSESEPTPGGSHGAARMGRPQVPVNDVEKAFLQFLVRPIEVRVEYIFRTLNLNAANSRTTAS